MGRRLKDLVNEGTCDLSQISHLVLDEADRMLDMGFEEDVRYIISQCEDKETRQTAMFIVLLRSRRFSNW